MKLAVLGDVHYPEMANGSAEAIKARDTYFSKVLDAFFKLEADYYIALGDVTHSGTEREFAFMSKTVGDYGLQDKYLHLLGNHELKRMTKSEVLAITGQPRYHAIDSVEARLVFLDTSVEKLSSGDIDEGQLDWFRATVQGTGAKPLIVFAHHPVYDTTPRSTEDGGRTTVKPSIDMKGILGLHQSEGLYVNGHIHINSIVRDHQWSYVQTTSLLDAPGYRTIEITEHEINVDYVLLEDEALREMRLFIASQLEHFRFNSNVLGNQTSDSKLTITKTLGGRS